MISAQFPAFDNSGKAAPTVLGIPELGNNGQWVECLILSNE